MSLRAASTDQPAYTPPRTSAPKHSQTPTSTRPVGSSRTPRSWSSFFPNSAGHSDLNQTTRRATGHTAGGHPRRDLTDNSGSVPEMIHFGDLQQHRSRHAHFHLMPILQRE